eukprot:1969031-Pyramimonas_sp.AAC.1
MSNASLFVRRCKRKCAGNNHHVHLEGGHRTKRSQTYPDELASTMASAAEGVAWGHHHLSGWAGWSDEQVEAPD